MRKCNLNIPAILIHEMHGNKYKVNGVLLSINESNDTCTMRFKGNYVEDNIPMCSIIINEGFLDKIKDYGRKVAQYITSKVKGFIALVDKASNTVFPWSLNNVGNLAIMAAKGNMPEGVYFAPSKSLLKIAGVRGLSIDLAFAESESKDKQEIVKYWSRVIKRTGTTPNETIEESVKFVNENYYRHITKKKGKKLNEAVYSYDNVKNDKGFGQFGVAVSSKLLKAKLKSNIRNQISGPLGGHADVVPFLIWGAPGIGKTAIIKSTIKEMAQSKFNSINLNLEVIMLAGYTIENWTLPRDNTRTVAGVNLATFTDTPKTWLPVYLNTSDEEEKKRRDHFCNTCKFLATEESGEITSENGHPYEGGVVFMDEYSRCAPNVQNIIMALGNDHRFGDNYLVASKWGFVFASNRSIDENEADSDDPRYFPTAAQTNRFKHFTYVPSKEEWVEWAREVDPITHEANVPPFIVDFIEATRDFVWYSTVVNGGYDDLLDNPESDKLAHKSIDYASAIQDVLGLETLLKTKRMVTPRTWANTIGPEYKLELINIFQGNNEDMTGEEYYKKLINDSVIEKTDNEGHSYKEYYGGILPNLLIDALNNVDDEYWEEWVNEKGGEDLLDPSGSFNGIRRRYNLFMAWFLDLVRDSIGDDSGTNAYTATSPVIQEWNTYQSYAKQFTPEVIQSIWETGKMPKEYLADDDKKPLSLDKFADTEYSKWKQVSTICFDVAQSVYDAYPGNLEKDIEKDIKSLNNAKILSDDQVIEKANELINEYSFKLNNKSVNLLFDKRELANIDTLRNKVNSLLYSKVARLYAHFASWIAKVSIQAENGRLASSYETTLFDSLSNIDSDISNKYLNSVAVRKSTIASDKAGNKDKELILTKLIEESKIPILPAISILHRAKSYDFDNARGKK